MVPWPVPVYGSSQRGAKSLLQLPITQFLKIQPTAACRKPEKPRKLTFKFQFVSSFFKLVFNRWGKWAHEVHATITKGHHTSSFSAARQVSLRSLDCCLRSSVVRCKQPPGTPVMTLGPTLWNLTQYPWPLQLFTGVWAKAQGIPCCGWPSVHEFPSGT